MLKAMGSLSIFLEHSLVDVVAFTNAYSFNPLPFIVVKCSSVGAVFQQRMVNRMAGTPSILLVVGGS